jgi:nucleoside-diphosphate-sugar epimerase
MKKAFITGINGFIGSNLAKQLIDQGIEVYGLVRKSSDLSFIKGLNLKLFRGDITNPGTLIPEWFNDIDTVFHVAGLAADWGPYGLFYKINVEGTQNIAKISAQAGVKRFVYISTVAFHGFGRTNIKETDPVPKKLIPYAKTKWLAEQWLWNFSKNTGMEITAIRPGNVFGPNDRTFMLKYLDAMEKGKFAQINHGKAKTCPTFILNLTNAIILAATHQNAPGNAFIVTDGLDIDWNTFNNLLAEEMGIKLKNTSIPYSIAMAAAKLYYALHSALGLKPEPFLTPYRINNGGKDYHFSIEKIKSMLGFTPPYDLKTAVRMTVQWYKDFKKH